MINACSRICRRLNSFALTLAIVSAMPLVAYAIGGTDRIAEPGKRFDEQQARWYDWPVGTLAMINDEARRYGWHHWFSELPNDGNWFDYEVEDTAEINRLIERMAAIASKRHVVVISAGEPPTHEKVRVAAEFSIGSQRRLDEWYDQLPADKQFGAQKIDKRPSAAPPHLTIYVEHEAVDLDRLEVPKEVDVELLKGHLPKTGEKPSPLQKELIRFVEQHEFRHLRLGVCPCVSLRRVDSGH